MHALDLLHAVQISNEEAYRLTRLEREVGYLSTPSQLAAKLYIIAI